MTDSGSALVKQLRRKSRTFLSVPGLNSDEDGANGQETHDWRFSGATEHDLLQEIAGLQSKLEMSAKLGQELLDREDSYKHQVQVMKEQLWRAEEEQVYLRRANQEQQIEIKSLREENYSITMGKAGDEDTQERLAQEVSTTENELHQHRIQIRELREQIHKLTVDNFELNDHIAEAKIEAEAQARLNQELNGRLQRFSSARPRSAISNISRPSSRPASRIGMRTESAEFGSPQQHHGRMSDAAWDFNEEEHGYMDDERVLELEEHIESLNDELASKEAMIDELRDELAHYRSFVNDSSSPAMPPSSPAGVSRMSMAQELSQAFGSPHQFQYGEPSPSAKQLLQVNEEDDIDEDETFVQQHNNPQDEELYERIEELNNRLATAEDRCGALEYQNQCLKTLLKTAQSNKAKRRSSRVILYPEGYVADANPDELISFPKMNSESDFDDVSSSGNITPASPLPSLGDSPIQQVRSAHVPKSSPAATAAATISPKRHNRHHSTPIALDQVSILNSLDHNPHQNEEMERSNSVPEAPVSSAPVDVAPVPDLSSHQKARHSRNQSLPAVPHPLAIPPPNEEVHVSEISDTAVVGTNALNVAVRDIAYKPSPQARLNRDNFGQVLQQFEPAVILPMDRPEAVLPVERQREPVIMVDQEVQTRVTNLDKSIQCDLGPIPDERDVIPPYVPPTDVRDMYGASQKPQGVQETPKSSNNGWCCGFLCCGRPEVSHDYQAMRD